MELQLDSNWSPDFVCNYTWVARDKNGLISLMLSNGYGWLPTVLLNSSISKNDINILCEYIDGESTDYINETNLNGSYTIDLYSSYSYGAYQNKDELIKSFNSRLENNKNCIAELATKMGMFCYEAIELPSEGDNYPIGYDGKTKMGDYYRFIVPTIFLTIDDIPVPLRNYIVVSDTIDFTKHRLLDNDKISEYFPRMYHD
ncbi:hypothetical protein NVI2019_PEGOAJLN_00871 [Providencia alcalifaciens]|uniref:hypothetical protein n=1 Tax=Providencia alcalifaciens TaxID=126385 RepID=UPI00044CACF0|nr:hypothetical protein [Providencia alcalifaciens]EUD03562.1 hypothetical protein HMPREF1565_3662 [Providencia alcalifaciens RIMD 1656011]CAG9412681.1 hypothetical protein NVI2019_PEGOAJLN_00871 [Providencia alcalifaciens]